MSDIALDLDKIFNQDRPTPRSFFLDWLIMDGLQDDHKITISFDDINLTISPDQPFTLEEQPFWNFQMNNYSNNHELASIINEYMKGVFQQGS